jgi:hypothetical protein
MSNSYDFEVNGVTKDGKPVSAFVWAEALLVEPGNTTTPEEAEQLMMRMHAFCEGWVGAE